MSRTNGGKCPELTLFLDETKWAVSKEQISEAHWDILTWEKTLSFQQNYFSKVMLKTPLFTRFQPKKSDENLPKPQKYFFQFFFVLKPKNWRKQIWSRIEFYNMWYVYLTFEVSWAEKLQNIEFPDFPLFFSFCPFQYNKNALNDFNKQSK